MNKRYSTEDSYKVVKMFKDTYTKLKLASTVYLTCSESGIINMTFSNDTGYFLTFGKLYFKNILSDLLLEEHCAIELNLGTLMDIGRLKKKEVVDIVSIDGNLIFNILDEDSVKMITAKKVDISKVPKNNFIFNYSEDIESLDDDVCLYYLDENKKLTKSKTVDKVIEVSSASLKVILPNSKISIKFTDKNENGVRDVCIGSKTDTMELYKIFRTI